MKKYLAEFIGTFTLIFCGTGAIIVDQHTGGVVSHVGVCLVWGAIVSCVIFALGDVSGAHINPAVTVGFWLARRFEGREIAPYILSQAGGAIAASAMLHFLFPDNKLLGGTYPAGSDMQSFIMEFLLTFFLMLLIMQVSTGAKKVCSQHWPLVLWSCLRHYSQGLSAEIQLILFAHWRRR
jgi:aquaporin NIP